MIRINNFDKKEKNMKAIIMVSCSCCSVVSYAYELNKYFTIPVMLRRVFVHLAHRFWPHLFFWASPSLPRAFFSLPLCSTPCPAPSLPLSLSLYSEPVTLGVHCLGWPHLQLCLPLCVSRSLSALYNRSRIRSIIAPWLLTAGVYCGFVWEGHTTRATLTFWQKTCPNTLLGSGALGVTWFD